MIAAYIDVSDVLGVGDITRDVRPRLGLDLKGGVQLVLQAQPRGNEPITQSQLESARTILEERASGGTGATEPVVQTAGSDRILVELPGIDNLEEAVSIIQTTAFLEIVDGGSTPLNEGTTVTTSLGGPRIRRTSEATATQTIAPGATITATGTTTGTTQPATDATPQPTPEGPVYQTIVSGDDIDGSKVAATIENGQAKVTFALKGDAANRMRDHTSSHLQQFMPIVLDKKVISSPRIQGIIADSGEITNLSLAEARKLAVQLKYGALPVGLELLESRKIAATLGQEAVDRSIVAGIIGLGLVVLFMITYYRLPGALASLALLVYAIITYAVFKLVPVTLTLAGIAGFILSIGMAVDANVLIFARLKEELRSGKTLGAAVEAGFDHAWPSIRDSNVSTLITCAILFWFGSTFGGASIIKGFALTLAIGVFVSLFTAITVSRTFLRAVVDTPLGRSKWAFNIDPGNRRGRATGTPVATTEA
jgi:preprotein translocase subunit SecD